MRSYRLILLSPWRFDSLPLLLDRRAAQRYCRTMIQRIVRSSFNATHAVVLPDGREPVHGHDWRVQLECEVPSGAGDSEQIVGSLDRVLAPLRHTHLNDIAALQPYEATAESVARYLFDELTRELADHQAKPLAVELEEEPGCRARYEIG